MRGVGDRWDAGDAYETYMGRWSRPLARAFVGWLEPKPSGHWLDVGCGTGALTSTIRELCQPASVVACDPSEPFIEHARRRIADPRVSFVVARDRDLPVRDGAFDAVVSSLVLNFVPDPEAAVMSMRDRLRPEGLVAASVWDYAGGMEFLRCFWDAARALDPAAAQLDEGVRFPICRAEALSSLFQRVGLQRVDTGALEIPTRFVDFEDYWSPFLDRTGPAPAYVASLEPERRALLRAELERRLHARPGPGIELRARAWAARGFAP